MSGISALYILDKKGRVLIFRTYRNDVPPNAHQLFNKKILEYDEYSYKPIIQDKEGNIFCQVRHNDLIIFAMTNRDSNALMIFSFLNIFVQVLQKYFREVIQQSIRDNFVIIYELLDQMIDFGYPQTTQFKSLKDFIKTESYQLKLNDSGNQKNLIQAAIQISSAISWRPQGLKYRKNQFFLDVVQHVSMLIGPSNNIIRSEVTGIVTANCKLSGMPNLRLGINDKAYFDMQGRESRSRAIDFDDIRFHQCVRLQRFQNERVVTFVPPDGQFQLFSYRMQLKVKPLFSAQAKILSNTTNKLTMQIKVRSNYKDRSSAKDVEVYIPVPEDAQTPSFQNQYGTCVYTPDKYSVCWKIPTFPGKKQMSMKCDMKLPSVPSPNRKKYLRMPINVKFEIPFYTVSGFQVRYLKIEDRSGYKAMPWVKYLTKNGDFNIRVHS